MTKFDIIADMSEKEEMAFSKNVEVKDKISVTTVIADYNSEVENAERIINGLTNGNSDSGITDSDVNYALNLCNRVRKSLDMNHGFVTENGKHILSVNEIPDTGSVGTGAKDTGILDKLSENNDVDTLKLVSNSMQLPQESVTNKAQNIQSPLIPKRSLSIMNKLFGKKRRRGK